MEHKITYGISTAITVVSTIALFFSNRRHDTVLLRTNLALIAFLFLMASIAGLIAKIQHENTEEKGEKWLIYNAGIVVPFGAFIAIIICFITNIIP